MRIGRVSETLGGQAYDADSTACNARVCKRSCARISQINKFLYPCRTATDAQITQWSCTDARTSLGRLSRDDNSRPAPSTVLPPLRHAGRATAPRSRQGHHPSGCRQLLRTVRGAAESAPQGETRGCVAGMEDAGLPFTMPRLTGNCHHSSAFHLRHVLLLLLQGSHKSIWSSHATTLRESMASGS